MRMRAASRRSKMSIGGPPWSPVSCGGPGMVRPRAATRKSSTGGACTLAALRGATLQTSMADTGKIAKNLERFAQAVASHDRENPTHTAHGIGLAHFDMERLGFDEGEEILPGITIHADSGVTGNFRVLCDGEHDEGQIEVEQETVEAVATQSVPV